MTCSVNPAYWRVIIIQQLPYLFNLYLDHCIYSSVGLTNRLNNGELPLDLSPLSAAAGCISIIAVITAILRWFCAESPGDLDYAGQGSRVGEVSHVRCKPRRHGRPAAVSALKFKATAPSHFVIFRYRGVGSSSTGGTLIVSYPKAGFTITALPINPGVSRSYAPRIGKNV